MKILAIDTSGQQAGAAIVDEYITIGEIQLNARTGEKSWHHSEILMPGVQHLFDLTGISPESIDYVAYTAGPGSFTGLRIGVATALGMARALEKPAIPVPTLDALAYNVLNMHTDGAVVPMMDARRGQVYAAIYESRKPSVGGDASQGSDNTGQYAAGLVRTTDYLALPVESLAEKIHMTPVILLGDGVDANRALLESLLPNAVLLPPNMNRQRASSVAVWALNQLKNGYNPAENADKVDIMYIRDPQAVRDRNSIKNMRNGSL